MTCIHVEAITRFPEQCLFCMQMLAVLNYKSGQ